MSLNSTTISNMSDDDTPWCHDERKFKGLYFGLYSFTFIVILLGLAGNILVIATLQSKCSKTITNFLLKSLAFWDGSFLLVVIVYILVDCISITADTWLKVHKARHVLIPVMLVLQLISIWHLVLVGLYRFISIYKPLWEMRFITMRKLYITIMMIVIACVLFHIPTFIMIVKITDSRDGVIVSYQGFFYQAPYFGDRYYMFFLFGCLYFLLPVTLLLIFNVGIIVAICRSKRSTNPGYHSLQEAKDITKSVVVILFVFILTYGPCLVAILDSWISQNIAEGSIFFSFDKCSSLVAFIVLFGILPFINSSVNCFIYLLVRKSFRKNLKELLTCNRDRGTEEEMTIFDVASRT